MQTDYPKMTALARTFRAFAPGGPREGVAWLVPFDAHKLHETSRPWSHSERATVDYLLSVFNPTAWKFDLHDALGIWDREDCEAFAAWAARPWWPQ